MESVLELRAGLVVLRRGAERGTILVSSGILGYALDKVKVRRRLVSLRGDFWRLWQPIC